MDLEHDLPLQLPAAPFPAPPPFWRHFTTENAARLAALEGDITSNKESLPADLAVLRPPPPPNSSADSYSVFSIPQSLNPIPPRPPADILLFDPDSPNFAPSKLLTRLTRSVLLNFLELTTILGNDPTQYADKMSDINRLMLNIHFVINLYRPHQAREGVKEMLQSQLDAGSKEIEQCDAAMEKIKGFLKSITPAESTSILTVDNISDQGQVGQSIAFQAQDVKKLWTLIDEIDDE